GFTGIIYTSSNTGVISIAAGKLHIKNAGITTITAKVGGVTYSQAVTVNKAPLIIKANNKSKTAGAVNPALDVVYTGFVYSDNATSLTVQPTVTTTAITSSPAGSYPITVGSAVAANYAITYEPGTLTVSKAVSNFALDSGTPVVSSSLSPNGDGINDYLSIANIEAYPDNTFLLMNSQGVQVYNTKRYNNLNNRFDGHSESGHKLPQGTYFYLLQYGSESIKGYVILKY
ncbi:MAG: gliding motility-associated C-terminal domain-containing protein, partial [Sphingobacteriaceae bacterium]